MGVPFGWMVDFQLENSMNFGHHGDAPQDGETFMGIHEKIWRGMRKYRDEPTKSRNMMGK